MIYFLQIIMILIAFFLSRKINLNLKNFDFPGKNKHQKKKVLTSSGIGPFVILTLYIIYLIYFSTAEYSQYYFKIPQIWIAPLSILVFTLVSFYDDLNYIPFQVRLIIQLIIVYLSISLIPINQIFNFQTPIFNGLLPVKVDIFITVIFWTFVINSTNFIDGYDGMFSFQTVSIFFGFATIFYLINEEFHLMISLFMFFIGIIFLPFNFLKKLKMYIGDAGSIPTGFILGWMIISLANMGHLLSAILINILFLTDILTSIFIRIINKKSIFERHNDFIFKKIIINYGAEKYYLIAIPTQIILILLSINFLN